MSKPETKCNPRLTAKILASMALGKPLHKLEVLCETQKTISSGRVGRMVEEAGDILKDYVYTLKNELDSAIAERDARIAELERTVRHHREHAIELAEMLNRMITESGRGVAHEVRDAIDAALAKHGGDV